MPHPSTHLPKPFTTTEISSFLTSLSLPIPKSTTLLKHNGAFHIIYILSYDSQDIQSKLPPAASKPKEGEIYDLILRISGDHIPHIKTENETAILQWVRQNTSIPVPDIIAFDSTTNNLLNREFMILNRCSGVAVADIYDTLSQEQLDSIMNQLIDILSELHRYEFDVLGGLMHSPENPEVIIPGPILDETMWFTADIPIYFPESPDLKFEDLNITGPYPDYVSFVMASIQKHIRVIGLHPSLVHLREYTPRLHTFMKTIATDENKKILNNTPIRLAHKDLHFENILIDPPASSSDITCKITAILDWEFASTVPFPRWDPPRAFLWNARKGDASYKEKYRLRDRFFKELCPKRDEEIVRKFLSDMEWTSKKQESMHLVMNMLRAVIEVTVREGLEVEGNKEKVRGWEEIFVRELKGFVE